MLLLYICDTQCGCWNKRKAYSQGFYCYDAMFVNYTEWPKVVEVGCSHPSIYESEIVRASDDYYHPGECAYECFTIHSRYYSGPLSIRGGERFECACYDQRVRLSRSITGSVLKFIFYLCVGRGCCGCGNNQHHWFNWNSCLFEIFILTMARGQ